MPEFESFTVGLNLGLVYVEGTWTPTEKERKAAWEMYVELVTRLPVAALGSDEGLLREALNSLYSLFGTTREILRRYGPDVARPSGPDNLSFGFIAVAVLNGSLRPLLARWHPDLLDFETTRPEGVSRLQHERQWANAEALRIALSDARRVLRAYAHQLEAVVDINPSLIIDPVSDGNE